MDEITDIWRKYEAARDQHLADGMYERVRRCHRFYEGDQWHGLRTGGEELPSLNFIKPVCRYQISMVAANETAILFSPLEEDERLAALCETLTRYAARQWEQGNMDAKRWTMVKNACIAGDHYLYMFDRREPTGSVKREEEPQLEMRPVSKEDVYLANEQQPDLQQQEWIILAERLPVEAVRRAAEKNGLGALERSRICADEDADPTAAADREVKAGAGKCTSLLYMEKAEGGVRFCRSTRGVVYQPFQTVAGLELYPLAAMRWEEKHGSARGVGVAERLIPNQIEVNKTIARRSICVKRGGYPTTVVDQEKVLNPQEIGKVGGVLQVRNLAGNPLGSLVQYLQPAPMSGDAAALESELLMHSRELEGAGDAATGQVDPTQASGEAIKAARDQSALALNEQTANYRRFVEDLAAVWFALWRAYGAAGVTLRYEQEGRQRREHIDPELLQKARVHIRIDVSPADPYSILSREMALENALAAGHITFEEYVEALDAGGGVPKDKFRAILQRRKTGGGAGPALPGTGALPGADPLAALLAGGMKGGEANALPQV